MKLIKFRIQNYKSIKDSRWCWLASDITALAGKNESGKSAILEALRDFDTDVKAVSDEAIPLDDSGEPVIEMCFEVDKTTLDEIAQETGVTITKETREYILKNGVTIIKYHDGGYGIEDEVDRFLNKQRNEVNEKHTEKIREIIGNLSKIERLAGIARPKLKVDVSTIQQGVNQYIEQVKAQVASIPEEEIRQQVNKEINELTMENSTLNKEDVANKFLDELNRYVPNFIFFSDFDDILPFEITLAEAKNHETVKDFAKVAEIDLDKVIETQDKQRRKNLLRDHSAVLSEDFMGYWEQDEIKLIADADGDNLILGTEESGKAQLFKIEQRSKGFQWFLSFYLRLRAREDNMNIILIDEPGLYLHAKAQKDVLKVLEKTSKESQVIFSTHSPYLIDAQRLDRVRLILKDDDKGSWIENKIHKGADTETLTPIITAVGLDISHDFSIVGKKNVLLEGISDYYFIQALREYVKTYDANFIPCVGASKIPQLVSLLIGWDLNFLAVLDNDTEGKKILKELKEKLSVSSDQIILISDQDGFSVEDLFTYDDFNNFFLEETKNDDITVANSKFLKDKKLDKVLLAKKFFEKVKEDKSKIKLSPDTIDSFKQVFDKIVAGFKKF